MSQKQRSVGLALLFSIVVVSPALAVPVFGPQYALEVFPREDSRQTDPVTGASLLFLTKAQSKDCNLYFHQRSWLADSSMILWVSTREKGGVMGYIVETGELVRILAQDGSSLESPTAAGDRNSVLALSKERVLEVELHISISEFAGARHATITARQREIARIHGSDGTLNESCDGRYLVTGQRGFQGGFQFAQARRRHGLCCHHSRHLAGRSRRAPGRSRGEIGLHNGKVAPRLASIPPRLRS
jgi:hypothetical protein